MEHPCGDAVREVAPHTATGVPVGQGCRRDPGDVLDHRVVQLSNGAPFAPAELPVNEPTPSVHAVVAVLGVRSHTRAGQHEGPCQSGVQAGEPVLVGHEGELALSPCEEPRREPRDELHVRLARSGHDDVVHVVLDERPLTNHQGFQVVRVRHPTLEDPAHHRRARRGDNVVVLDEPEVEVRVGLVEHLRPDVSGCQSACDRVLVARSRDILAVAHEEPELAVPVPHELTVDGLPNLLKRHDVAVVEVEERPGRPILVHQVAALSCQAQPSLLPVLIPTRRGLDCSARRTLGRDVIYRFSRRLNQEAGQREDPEVEGVGATERVCPRHPATEEPVGLCGQDRVQEVGAVPWEGHHPILEEGLQGTDLCVRQGQALPRL